VYKQLCFENLENCFYLITKSWFTAVAGAENLLK
jgi:hypothetical protein